MKNFRTLEMAVNFYQNAKNLKLKHPLQNQYDRALLSIVLNLTEGSAKPSAKERKRFYYIALGSLREVQMILKLTQKLKLLSESDALGASLYKLCKNT